MRLPNAVLNPEHLQGLEHLSVIAFIFCMCLLTAQLLLNSHRMQLIMPTFIPQRFKLRLPVRDMRMVDPNLLTSETGKILVRDNGIVVSVEHVRLIIMAEQARSPGCW